MSKLKSLLIREMQFRMQVLLLVFALIYAANAAAEGDKCIYRPSNRSDPAYPKCNEPTNRNSDPSNSGMRKALPKDQYNDDDRAVEPAPWQYCSDHGDRCRACNRDFVNVYPTECIFSRNKDKLEGDEGYLVCDDCEPKRIPKPSTVPKAKRGSGPKPKSGAARAAPRRPATPVKAEYWLNPDYTRPEPNPEDGEPKELKFCNVQRVPTGTLCCSICFSPTVVTTDRGDVIELGLTCSICNGANWHADACQGNFGCSCPNRCADPACLGSGISNQALIDYFRAKDEYTPNEGECPQGCQGHIQIKYPAYDLTLYPIEGNYKKCEAEGCPSLADDPCPTYPAYYVPGCDKCGAPLSGPFCAPGFQITHRAAVMAAIFSSNTLEKLKGEKEADKGKLDINIKVSEEIVELLVEYLQYHNGSIQYDIKKPISSKKLEECIVVGKDSKPIGPFKTVSPWDVQFINNCPDCRRKCESARGRDPATDEVRMDLADCVGCDTCGGSGDMPTRIIFQFILGCNFWSFTPGLHLGCAKVATLIKGLSPAEIKVVLEDGNAGGNDGIVRTPMTKCNCDGCTTMIPADGRHYCGQGGTKCGNKPLDCPNGINCKSDNKKFVKRADIPDQKFCMMCDNKPFAKAAMDVDS